MKTISFYAECSARSEVTLSSGRINQPFKTKRITVTFPRGCQNLMQVKFFQSADGNTPSSGEPSDVSVLAENGHVDYVVGDGCKKVMEHEVQVDEAGSYLKVYANNEDYYAHDVDVQIEVEPLERR